MVNRVKRTVIVVSHDYAAFIPHQRMVLLDPSEKRLREVAERTHLRRAQPRRRRRTRRYNMQQYLTEKDQIWMTGSPVRSCRMCAVRDGSGGQGCRYKGSCVTDKQFQKYDGVHACTR